MNTNKRLQHFNKLSHGGNGESDLVFDDSGYNNFIRKLKFAGDTVLKKKYICIPRNDPSLNSSSIFSLKLGESAAAIGPKTNTIHYHADITIFYDGRSPGYFHLDRDAVKEYMLDKLPLDNIYVNFQHVRNFKTAVADYISNQNALDPDFDYTVNLEKYRKNPNYSRDDENGGGDNSEPND